MIILNTHIKEIFIMQSLWQSTSELPHFKRLEGNIKTDALIIGGGIAGILTAYLLKQSGVDYVLVEKDKICGGTTGHTTAKLTLQHGLIDGRLLKQYGKEKTSLYYDANKKALEQYARLCSAIDCGYEIKNNYVYSRDNRSRLEVECTAIRKIGKEAEFIEKVPLPIKTAGAVCIKEQAQFHPLKFLSEIAKNLNIYEHTFVREMIGNKAVTDLGTISAKNVIVTTHFPFINKHGSYFLKLYQHRSYVIALRGAGSVGGMYVDEDKKGFSFRDYKDYLLLGGGGHRTGNLNQEMFDLIKFVTYHYPKAKCCYEWAAQDCMSLDGVPYIGKYSASTKNLYTATGFNKWGMTGAMVAAQLLTDIITEKKNQYLSVFSPSRSIVKPQLFINASEATKNLLTFSTKRCPHMGCALKWNKAEHTWDCPCHGSRFSRKGILLDNPANGDLKN